MTHDVWLADASPLPRIGLKGPAASDWLRARNVSIPDRPNTWAPLTAPLTGQSGAWSLIARLGHTEFLIEEEGDARIDLLSTHLQTDTAGVYPVLREDNEFVLGGAMATAVLKEVCNVDFASLDDRAHTAVLTMMASVSVLVIPQTDGTHRRYRIWCDPSFGAYLWNTLHDVVTHHSGVILGLEQLAHAPRLPPTIERIALGEDA